MKNQKVLIIGSSGHAKVIIDIFEKEGSYEIIGLIDSFRSVGEETLGYKVLGDFEDIPKLIANETETKLFIAIGDNWSRKIVNEKISKFLPEADYANAIHPSAQIGKDVQLGSGIAIMPGAIINSSCIVEDFAIINTRASLDHDCKMAAYSSLGPNAVTGGNVQIGEFSIIGISATIINDIQIGKHVLVGAGAVLTKNCEDNSLMNGMPARKIKTREVGDKYL